MYLFSVIFGSLPGNAGLFQTNPTLGLLPLHLEYEYEIFTCFLAISILTHDKISTMEQADKYNIKFPLSLTIIKDLIS